MNGARNYIVYAPRYNPNSGGNIFLHQLVHYLNEYGESAYIWPWRRPPRLGIKYAGFTAGRALTNPFRKNPVTNPELNTPVASYRDLSPDSIVVYPEVTLGNPLHAENIVRWLLYMPEQSAIDQFSDNEMFFRAGQMCDVPAITNGASDLFVWKRNPIYWNQHRADRKGACVLVRKGANKERIPETKDATEIDGRSHEEIAELFNSCEVFYSYDEASFYSQYAALCGCVSIVIPGLFHSREDWVANHPIARFGIAYGLNDIGHAKSTMHLVDDLLREKEMESKQTVRDFIRLSRSKFC